MSWFSKTLLILSLMMLLLSPLADAGIMNGRSARSVANEEISKQCYFCVGNKEGGDNVETCSVENNLVIEDCPIQDRFDKCVVMQAFSKSKNTTIFKRECTSKRFCVRATVCSDPDYTDCRFECCTGDLCNNFDFKREEIPETTPSTVLRTTVGGRLITTKPYETSSKTFTKPEKITTESGIAGGPPITKLQTTKANIEATEDSDCVDIDKMCSKYTPNPIYMAQYCKDYKTYMMEYCRKTCNYCRETSPTVTTTIQTSAPTTNSQVSDCADQDSTCATYVTNAMYLPRFCEDNKSYTSINCRKTCKFCVDKKSGVVSTKAPAKESVKTTAAFEECQDRRSQCVRVANKDYCQLHYDLMIVECRRSCGFCSEGAAGGPPLSAVKSPQYSSKPTPEATSKATSQATSKATPEATSKATSQATSKATSQATSTARTPPPDSQTQKPDEKEECKDNRKDCNLLAKEFDYCRVMLWFMQKNCRKTCNFCSNEDNGNSFQQAPGGTTKAASKPTTQAKLKTTAEPTLKTTAKTTTEVITDATPEPTTEPTTEPTPKATAKTTSEFTTDSTPETTSEITPKPSTAPTASTKTVPETTATIDIETTTKASPETTSERPKSKSTTESALNSITKPAVKPTSNKKCKDKRKQCSKYANYKGYCQYHEKFMRKHCPQSCGFCNGDETSEPEYGSTSPQLGITAPTPSTPKAPRGPTYLNTASTSTVEISGTRDIPRGPTKPQATSLSSTRVSGSNNRLRWIVHSWSQCIGGLQTRVVRCWHSFEGKDYQVAIQACIDSVSEMPQKQRPC